MDAKFQSSFIPKQPINTGPVVTGHVSLFYVICLIIFIVVSGLAVAAFMSERIIKKNIDSLNAQVIEAQSSFELGTIDYLKRANLRIDATKELLEKHISFSKFFEFLNTVTYKNVYFTDFSYIWEFEQPVVKVKGTAVSFNTLVLQSDLFKQTKQLSEPIFTDFSLDSEGGISFSFQAKVNGDLISYKKNLQGI